jgi:chromosome segregation ATPase
MAQLDTTPQTEGELRARIAELEALLEARTETIVSLGAQLAELRGDGSPVMAERLREAERQLAELQATKVMRYSAGARKVYSLLRGGHG